MAVGRWADLCDMQALLADKIHKMIIITNGINISALVCRGLLGRLFQRYRVFFSITLFIFFNLKSRVGVSKLIPVQTTRHRYCMISTKVEHTPPRRITSADLRLCVGI